MALFLGVDGALTRSGIVALTDRGNAPYDDVVITTKTAQKIEERLHQIRVSFHSWVAEIRRTQQGPVYVAIESPFAGPNMKSFEKLSMVHAIFSMAAWDFSAEATFHVPPHVLKKFVCRTSYRTTKSDLREAVYDLWHYDNTDQDVVDAYALAHYARCAVLGAAGGYRESQVEITGREKLEAPAT